MSIRFSPVAKTPRPQAAMDSGMSEPQLNLLAHAQAIELDIGSQCGGHGVCGGDRVRIPFEHRSSFSALTDAEREHLSAEELADGWRLACQCWPDRADLEMQAEFNSPRSGAPLQRG